MESNSLSLGSSERNGLLTWWPVIMGVLVLFVPSYYWLANGPWNTEAQAHGPIVIAVVIWMLWRNRNEIKNIQDSAWPLLGSCVLGLGLLIYVVGRSQGVPIFEIGSQEPIVVGLILILRGPRTLKYLWFPLVFLLFMVPLPGFILDSLTGPLKYMISGFVENILYTFGYPIAQSGVVLYIGPYQLLVADACSGLNSMYSLCALGLLYVHLVQHRNKWRIALLMLSILPIAILCNLLRIIGLVLLTYYFGYEVGQGFFHEFTGVILFGVAIVLLLAFDKLLGMKKWISGKESLHAPA